MADDKAQAVEFFRQLDVFSKRYCQSLSLETNISRWGGEAYERGEPSGAILHYTADPSLESVVRWFVDPKLNAKVSAHVVIDDKSLEMAEHADGLPLIQELPVAVILCRPPDKMAWHATWVNGACFGVECVNAGELRTQDNGVTMTWWPAKAAKSGPWTKVWKPVGQAATHQAGRWWAPFPPKQLEAAATVLRYLRAMFPDSLRPGWILGHEQVQGVRTRMSNGAAMGTDKRDAGPTFPLPGLRQAVFDDWKPLTRYDWFQRYCADAQWGDSERVRVLQAAIPEIYGRSECLETVDVFQRFHNALATLARELDGPFGPWGKLALYLLGYYMPSIARGEYTSPDMDSDELTSVATFQRLMGLQVDSKPGSLTRTAIRERIKDRGF